MIFLAGLAAVQRGFVAVVDLHSQGCAGAQGQGCSWHFWGVAPVPAMVGVTAISSALLGLSPT